jgi:hypothetical protein
MPQVSRLGLEVPSSFRGSAVASRSPTGLEARFWTTSRLPSIHQFLNTSVFSEERPSRDDEQYNYVVLAKAADLRDARQRMKLDRYHPHPLDFAGFRLPTRCVPCAKLLNRSHGGPRTR